MQEPDIGSYWHGNIVLKSKYKLELCLVWKLIFFLILANYKKGRQILNLKKNWLASNCMISILILKNTCNFYYIQTILVVSNRQMDWRFYGSKKNIHTVK